MLYEIPGGSYIDLDCIQSVIPEYEEKHISWNDDNSLAITKNPRPCNYLISLTNGQQFCLEIEDYKALIKVLIKEGLMIPDQQESEGVLSNDPWKNNGQQEPKDPHKKESEEA